MTKAPSYLWSIIGGALVSVLALVAVRSIWELIVDHLIFFGITVTVVLALIALTSIKKLPRD